MELKGKQRKRELEISGAQLRIEDPQIIDILSVSAGYIRKTIWKNRQNNVL